MYSRIITMILNTLVDNNFYVQLLISINVSHFH
jgi:hypothetical protein